MGEDSTVETTYRLQICTELCRYLLLQPCIFHYFSSPELLTCLCQCSSLIIYEATEPDTPKCVALFWCQNQIPHRTHFTWNWKSQALTSDPWRWRDCVGFLQSEPLNAALVWNWSTINVFFEQDLQLWNSWAALISYKAESFRYLGEGEVRAAVSSSFPFPGGFWGGLVISDMAFDEPEQRLWSTLNVGRYRFKYVLYNGILSVLHM